MGAIFDSARPDWSVRLNEPAGSGPSLRSAAERPLKAATRNPKQPRPHLAFGGADRTARDRLGSGPSIGSDASMDGRWN